MKEKTFLVFRLLKQEGMGDLDSGSGSASESLLKQIQSLYLL